MAHIIYIVCCYFVCSVDSLILKPLDDLFHAMLDDGASSANNNEAMAARSRIPVMFDDPLPQNNPIDAYFTRDYNMVNPGHKHVGVQGGFLIVRPNMDAFRNYVAVVLEGNFKQGNGWGGKGYGGYFGAQQIQGICSYYYDFLHPGTGVELNKCYYNVMADAPRQSENAKTHAGKCRDGRETCQDCRDVPIDEIKSVHFTLCQKPWKCPSWVGDDEKTTKICEKFHERWFAIREDLERKKKGNAYKNPEGKYRPDVFHGFCKNRHNGYIPIG